MYCKQCGISNNEGSRFCKGCGFKLTLENDYQDVYEASNAQIQSQPMQAQPTVIYFNEENAIPNEYTPISAWGYFGYQILFSIPLLGIIFLIVCSFNSNINLRNFARSYWCVFVIMIVLSVICGAAIVAMLSYFVELLNSLV